MIIRNQRLKNSLASVVVLLLASCASRSANTPHNQALHGDILARTKALAPDNPSYRDPLEPINRSIWRFNYEFLDPMFLRPMAIAWRGCVPQPMRQGISDALSNIDELPCAINYLLIGNFSQALKQVARFLINTTAGVGGLFDVALQAGLPKRAYYSFGHVLGYYQVSTGPYLVLPVYGPSTPRQLIGIVPEQLYYFPLTWLTFWSRLGKGFLQGLENRSQFLDYEAVLRQSHDSYLTVRSAYLQRLQFALQENQTHIQDSPQEERSLSPEAIEQLD
ncbi:MAG: VacJ family lipoprotein [Candidatus Symbiodolus clandestinus]